MTNQPFDKNAFGGSRYVVTGGASGIGAALVSLLCEHGGLVAVLDRDGDRAAEHASRFGSSARAWTVDVGRRDEVTTAVNEAADWLGRIDGVANVAGTVRNRLLEEEDDFDALLGIVPVNLYGPLWVTLAALPHLRRSSVAAIVNVGSIAAGQAYPGGGLYGASKAGLVALTKQLAIELAPDIRVNIVNPGSIQTPMAAPATEEDHLRQQQRDAKIPLHRRGEPIEVAAMIAFLLSPVSSYTTAQEIIVGGGIDQTILPGPFRAG